MITWLQYKHRNVYLTIIVTLKLHLYIYIYLHPWVPCLGALQPPTPGFEPSNQSNYICRWKLSIYGIEIAFLLCIFFLWNPGLLHFDGKYTIFSLFPTAQKLHSLVCRTMGKLLLLASLAVLRHIEHKQKKLRNFLEHINSLPLLRQV